MAETNTKRVLIVVRTYPSPAQKGVEVSCTAGITEEGAWIRLFPVPYRFLDSDQRFRKYQWIDVSVRKASDVRPESHRIISESIKIVSTPLSTDDEWRARKNIVAPLIRGSLCAIRRERDERGFPTLGIFRPKLIKRLTIEPSEPAWSAQQLTTLRQKDLFQQGPQEELEKVPFNFRYEFECDVPECPGHKMICTDWEMGALWRRCRDQYGDDWESKFRQRYESEMINKFDTHFYVGTVHQYPSTWIIVGIFYPPRPTQPRQEVLFPS